MRRREFLASSGAFALSVAGGACTGSEESRPSGGFEERFAGFSPADEPNGDLSRVVWPDFVTEAGPDVRRLYEYAITHGDVLRYMPCYCGCGNTGHRNNRDCYVRRVEADGAVVLDSMAPT